ncbi:MAG: 50S ribosomal protein L28 [Deltaproteobacteria bacterium]|nr:50S ribosomal protein L28 [Deltaproteobacteria bacterium]
MSARCEVCGKTATYGNNISHAHNKTRRRWNPNIQRVRANINGNAKRVRVCARCIRSNAVKKAA